MSMRENIIKLLGDDVCEHDSCENCEYKENRDDCISFLKERMADYLIANDVVQVVRCRDCAKLGLFTCPICFIENKTLQFINISPDFFCGEGERKDGDGNGA